MAVRCLQLAIVCASLLLLPSGVGAETKEPLACVHDAAGRVLDNQADNWSTTSHGLGCIPGLFGNTYTPCTFPGVGIEVRQADGTYYTACYFPSSSCDGATLQEASEEYTYCVGRSVNNDGCLARAWVTATLGAANMDLCIGGSTPSCPSGISVSLGEDVWSCWDAGPCNESGEVLNQGVGISGGGALSGGEYAVFGTCIAPVPLIQLVVAIVLELQPDLSCGGGSGIGSGRYCLKPCPGGGYILDGPEDAKACVMVCGTLLQPGWGIGGSVGYGEGEWDGTPTCVPGPWVTFQPVEDCGTTLPDLRVGLGFSVETVCL